MEMPFSHGKLKIGGQKEFGAKNFCKTDGKCDCHFADGKYKFGANEIIILPTANATNTATTFGAKNY